MKPKTQFAANMNTFDALPVGAGFSLAARKTYRLIEVFHKIDAERVQAADGRIWFLAQTAISGGEIISPHGTFTHGQHELGNRLFGMTNEEARAALKN